MNKPTLSDWLERDPYSLAAKDKSVLLGEEIKKLTEWHYNNCTEYKNIVQTLGIAPEKILGLSDTPFLPVRLFKEFELRSVDISEVFKTMTSSGTTGQQVSKIYLDRETAALQTKVLSKIMQKVIGKKRLPMLIVDTPNVLKNRDAFSARGAGILGFSMFGTDITYALYEDMSLNINAINTFLEKYVSKEIFLFGFTFMIWKYLVQELQQRNLQLNVANGVLLHGGGWKKMEDEAVNNDEFKRTLKKVCGVNTVLNYYGMVEQTGSIFTECRCGYLHAPIYADIIIRRAVDLTVAEIGEEGLIQTISMLPESYPGHSLLTEDLGTLIGEDDCECGTLGKYFTVAGRIEQAEIRGCSDTHEQVV